MVTELQLIVIKWMIYVAFVIIVVMLMMFYIPTFVDHIVSGQNASVVIPPKPVISPPNPTPTTPNPNFQYLPQKAFVYSFAPENGVSNISPLAPLTQGQTPIITVAPPVTTPPPTGNILDQFGGIAGILAMAGAAGVYVKTHFMNKVVKENAVQIVKGAEVDKKIATQVYENMPDKGESINDKPEIRLDTLRENQEEATETAAKA